MLIVFLHINPRELVVKFFLSQHAFGCVDSTGWGYAPRYYELRQRITSAVPAAVVTGHVGRRCELY